MAGEISKTKNGSIGSIATEGQNKTFDSRITPWYLLYFQLPRRDEC